MKVTHLKNIIIVALAVLNVFFLGFVVARGVKDVSVRAETHRQLQTLLLQSGIDLNVKGIREGGTLFIFETKRDTEWEGAAAEALLGAVTALDRGGNITEYVGVDGRAVFRGGGEFEITFKAGAVDGGTDLVKTAERILGDMKISVIDTAQNDQTVTAMCALRGIEIFNCTIDFTFVDGDLTSMIGKHAGNVQLAQTPVEMASCATALMRFVTDVDAGKYSCAVMTGVRPGYNLFVSAFDMSLRPVWLVETDTGIYYVDAQSGDIVRQSA